MRFMAPPGWPSTPPEWVPERGWRPDPAWPAAPSGWAFWVDSAGAKVAGPVGVYGARWRYRHVAALVGAAVVLAGLLGIGLGASTSSVAASPQAITTVTTTESPAIDAPAAVTATVTATGPTTTLTAAPQTITTTMTQHETVTVTVTAAAAAGVSAPENTAGGAVPFAGGSTSSAYYANCAAARAAGAAPLYRGEAGYRAALDRDGDGVACEN